jgi:hypothetical protein
MQRLELQLAQLVRPEELVSELLGQEQQEQQVRRQVPQQQEQQIRQIHH